MPLGIGGFVHRMHRLESALGAVLGSDGGTVCGGGHVGPSRWSPCWTTVVAFERLRQTHVRVKNRESPAAIMCLGVWLTRHLADKRAHCCTLRYRGTTSWVVAPVCHPASGQHGTDPHLCGSRTTSPCGAHGIPACASAVRLCTRACRRGGVAVRHVPLRARHARTVCMYEPIPTSSGWIAAAAQKLWSRGLRTLDHRLCLGLLRGAQVVFRGY